MKHSTKHYRTIIVCTGSHEDAAELVQTKTEQAKQTNGLKNKKKEGGQIY